jgi:hypothetical protein
VELHEREIDYLKSASRRCGLSYRSACRRSSGRETAKRLQNLGLLYLHDKGESRQFGRYIFRITEKGREVLSTKAEGAKP